MLHVALLIQAIFWHLSWRRQGLFRLGTRAGVLDRFFPYNSFAETEVICDFQKNDIPLNPKKLLEYVLLSLRDAVKVLSVGNGQGYLKCNWNSSCKTKRCTCVAAKIACSSNVMVKPVIVKTP